MKHYKKINSLLKQYNFYEISLELKLFSICVTKRNAMLRQRTVVTVVTVVLVSSLGSDVKRAALHWNQFGKMSVHPPSNSTTTALTAVVGERNNNRYIVSCFTTTTVPCE